MHSVQYIRLPTSPAVHSVKQYTWYSVTYDLACTQCTAVYSPTLKLASPPHPSSYLCGLGCSSLGGCDTEAKSHRCTKERARHDVNQRHDSTHIGIEGETNI